MIAELGRRGMKSNLGERRRVYGRQGEDAGTREPGAAVAMSKFVQSCEPLRDISSLCLKRLLLPWHVLNSIVALGVALSRHCLRKPSSKPDLT
jgi:hypothetical protein